MSSLREIETQIMRVLAVPEELGEEETALALETLASLAIEEAQKIDGISFVVRKRKSEIEFLKEEEKRIKSIRQSMEKRLEEFRDYLKGLMAFHGLKSLKGAKGSMFLRDSMSLVIEDPDSLPAEFLEQVIEYKPLKKEIKAALESGARVPGAQLVKNSVITIK